MDNDQCMSQATEVIARFPGGIDEVAEVLNVPPGTVYKWDYPKEKGGRGGFIPPKYHIPLLRAARARGYRLKPRDFIGYLFCEVAA